MVGAPRRRSGPPRPRGRRRAACVTLVFDKGNNSGESLERVRHDLFRFIGSLVPTQHLDLLASRPDQLPGQRSLVERRALGQVSVVLAALGRRSRPA